MPSFEMVLIVRKLAKPELSDTLKRAANFILDNNGVLRKIENLGYQPLHHKITNPIPNAKRFQAANFFVYHLETSMPTMLKISEDCRHDNDVMRMYFLKKENNVPNDYECTLDEEFKPPSVRKSVAKLIEEGRKEEPEHDAGDPQTNPMQVM